MKGESKLRAAACWLTVAVSLWSLTYYFAYGTKEGSAFIIEDLTVPLISEFDISWENGARLVMLIAPTLMLTSFCLLVVTNAPLLSHLQIWTNRIFSRFRGFSGVAGDGINKKNQFGLGEVNFDALSFFLVTAPCIFFFFATLDKVMSGPDLVTELKLKAIGNAFGMAGTLALSFFLIPVTRHSVLLVAIGWSPLQALRIHVWAGYTSFISIVLHGIIHVIVWVQREDVSLWDQVMPDSVCWEWKSTEDKPKNCRIQFYNFTGLLAFFFFAILVVTSLNWFRRRYYKLFYICHMTFGIGMLTTAVMHWRPIITFIAPSIVYYLASTMPALVQALASRVRGGAKVVKVVHLADAGGCKEIHVATTDSANTALDAVPSMFIKMCVPSISMVWHPFTVFKHPQDPSTVRILFRPVGPFTKALALRWEQEKHTPTILDGFYHAGNRTLEALHHDHVIFYCGGVAITPFLSLIPDLIAEIGKQKELGNQIKTNKLVFFWACREEGLATYITENYLKGMKRAAAAIGFDFDVIVYHTKRTAKFDPTKSKDENEATSNVLDTTFMSELTLDADGVEVDRRQSVRLFEYQDQEVPTSLALMADETNPLAAQQSSEVSEYTHAVGEAHDMELHRFMPARHTRVWNNIPALIAVGGSLWLFFYIIFYYYNGYDIYAHEFYDRLWPLIVCLLTSIVLGLGFETTALFASTANKDFGGKDCTGRPTSPVYLPVDEESEDCRMSSVVEHRCGRPDIADIFRESRQAECPGIFMCGPPAMTEKVRQEANKENSIFGLTRYALYEDPFEM